MLYVSSRDNVVEGMYFPDSRHSRDIYPSVITKARISTIGTHLRNGENGWLERKLEVFEQHDKVDAHHVRAPRCTLDVYT